MFSIAGLEIDDTTVRSNFVELSPHFFRGIYNCTLGLFLYAKYMPLIFRSFALNFGLFALNVIFTYPC